MIELPQILIEDCVKVLATRVYIRFFLGSLHLGLFNHFLVSEYQSVGRSLLLLFVSCGESKAVATRRAALHRLTGRSAQKNKVATARIAACASDLRRHNLARNTTMRAAMSGRKVCASVQCR